MVPTHTEEGDPSYPVCSARKPLTDAQYLTEHVGTLGPGQADTQNSPSQVGGAVSGALKGGLGCVDLNSRLFGV